MSTFDLIHNKIASTADNLQGKKVLDYGCGKGGLIDQLNSNYSSILAVDVNDKSLELVQTKYSNLIDKHKLELKQVKSPKDINETYDVIFCHNVLECFSDRVGFTNDLFELLNDGGELILSNLDFDSAIYNHPDVKLTRELLHLFNDTKQDWMQNHDGQIGRKSKGIFNKSLFKNYVLNSILISETEYTDQCYGYNMAQWIMDIASKKYDTNILNDWLKGLKDLAKENDYYFSINLMIIKAIK